MPEEFDRFADQLDRMVAGQAPAGERGLSAFAREVQGIGSERIDDEQRDRIRRRLMQHANSAASTTPTSGGAGPLSQPTLNKPWTLDRPTAGIGSGAIQRAFQASLPVSNRTRRAAVKTPPHRLNAWLSAAIVAMLLLGSAGSAWWFGAGRGDPRDEDHVRLAAITENAGTPIATPLVSEWWTAWSTCDITPVHTEAPPANGPHMLPGMPWLQAETLNGSETVLYVWLWTGNRPLPVNGEYADEQMNAEWLWEFVPPMEDMTITATNERGTTGTVEHGGSVLSSSTGGNEWPSTVVLPEPGCWTFDITATTHDGEIYEGRVVFPAVP